MGEHKEGSSQTDQPSGHRIDTHTLYEMHSWMYKTKRQRIIAYKLRKKQSHEYALIIHSRSNPGVHYPTAGKRQRWCQFTWWHHQVLHRQLQVHNIKVNSFQPFRWDSEHACHVFRDVQPFKTWWETNPGLDDVKPLLTQKWINMKPESPEKKNHRWRGKWRRSMTRSLWS